MPSGAAVATHIAGRIVSTEPLITFSSTNRVAPLGIVSTAPEQFAERRALHLLHHTWSLETGDAAFLCEAIRKARFDLPLSEFVLLAANDAELLAVEQAGGRAILGNGLIFTDERAWRPVPPTGTERFDAVYVARFDPEKRHQLAADVESLELIYGWELSDQKGGLERVRQLLPHARFANHQLEPHRYAYLDQQQVCARLAHARVGLCLSAVEGCMRASMEYMLSGLAVVSTRSLGGRDRFFLGSYCEVVDDTPDAVAAAVRRLAAQEFDRLRIRAHVGQLIAFERNNFRLAVNRLVEQVFGIEAMFAEVAPFVGLPARMEPASQIAAHVEETLADVPRQAGVAPLP
jgi:glycosyltransferase involved in cell wall biosynthesis